MLYKKIVVPFDGSEPARSALTVAKKLIADDPAAELHVLSVVRLTPSRRNSSTLPAPLRGRR